MSDDERKKSMSWSAGAMGAAPPPGADMGSYYAGVANRPSPPSSPLPTSTPFAPAQASPIVFSPPSAAPTPQAATTRMAPVRSGGGSSSTSSPVRRVLLLIVLGIGAKFYFDAKNATNAPEGPPRRQVHARPAPSPASAPAPDDDIVYVEDPKYPGVYYARSRTGGTATGTNFVPATDVPSPKAAKPAGGVDCNALRGVKKSLLPPSLVEQCGL